MRDSGDDVADEEEEEEPEELPEELEDPLTSSSKSGMDLMSKTKLSASGTVDALGEENLFLVGLKLH